MVLEIRRTTHPALIMTRKQTKSVKVRAKIGKVNRNRLAVKIKHTPFEMDILSLVTEEEWMVVTTHPSS